MYRIFNGDGARFSKNVDVEFCVQNTFLE